MTEKESRSMAKQLTYCYSANTKAAVPLCLYFTGLDGEVGEALLKSSPGYKNWAVRHEEGSYLDALAERKGDLVYLTADSEHELTEFKPNEVYIIGGIVDKNRHKNLTLNKANEQGIRHARLPIRDHLKMTGTHILTVNQALDIVLAQLELKDWDKAMERAVPVRKQAKECTEEDRKKEGDAELSE
jgi:tRNA (guanine9-N1)-methyltransferase